MRARKPSVPEHRVLHVDGTEADVGVIKSVMYYPEDDVARARYLQWHRLLELGDDQFRDLDLGGSVEKERLAELTRQATRAGAVLACYHLLDRMKERGGVFAKPSLEKAVHAVEEYAHHADQFQDGSTIHASRGALLSHWQAFRAVTPLWAAMWLNQAESPYAFMSPDAQFDGPGDVEFFLGVAKGLRDFGTGIFDAQGRPLLARGTWDVPGRIVTRLLPASAPDDERLITIMGRYEARKTPYLSKRIVK